MMLTFQGSQSQTLAQLSNNKKKNQSYAQLKGQYYVTTQTKMFQNNYYHPNQLSGNGNP